MATSTVRQDKPFGSDHGLIHEAVVTGRKVGADEDFWKVLAHDEALFRQLVSIVKGDEPVAWSGVDYAARIMGNNFHPHEAAQKYFGLKKLDAETKAAFQVLRFSTEMLEAAKDTHVLVPILPLSLMDIHGKQAKEFYSSHDPWFGEANQEFGRTKAEPGWYLVRKDAVPGSTSRTWDQQQRLLGNDEFVPKAAVATQAALLHYLLTGERIFSSIWLRTNDVAAHGYRVRVFFDSDGLLVNDWDDYAYSYIGVASSRKSS